MIARRMQRFATAIKRPAVAYAVALGAVVVAAALVWAVGLVMPDPPPFMAFFPAIVFATLVAGARGGLLATAASMVAVWALFAPRQPVATLWSANYTLLLMFAATASLMVLLSKAMRLAIRQGAETETRFRVAQENSREGFVILEPVTEDGRVVDFIWTYANPAAVRIVANEGVSLVNRRIKELFPAEGWQETIAYLAAVLANGGAAEREIRRNVRGEDRWIHSSVAPLDGSLAVTFRDVTEQRQATHALRTREARTRAMVDALPLLVWSHRPDGYCDYLSAQWTRYTGAPAEQHQGMGWLDAIHAEDRDDIEQAWLQAVAGELPYDVEYRLRRHDGAWRWFNSRATAIRGEDGAIVRWIGTSSDITEIVEARRDLEERVAERTRELQASLEERARAEAALAQSQRLETVGRLTGGVAHDFNNLLTVVIGGLDMILRAPEDTARVRRLSEAALAAGRRGERLTRQLLAFSRRQELKLETVEVSALIDQVEPLVRRAVGEARELQIRCEADVGAARLDSAQFEAALLNLVVNASDAAPADGVIRIEAARAALAEGEAPDCKAGDYVRVTVSDNGAGMSPEVLGRVFEPFFTTKEVGKGTGLGLAQVYGFVRQCGGTVDIKSTAGQGTAVNLYLPASTEAVATAAAPAGAVAEPEAAAGAKVLLVEDDAAVRAVTEGLLQEMGCIVSGEADGPAALRRLDAGERFDLLISDVVMPGGMTGVDLARAAETRAPDMPIVLTTGYAGRRLDAPPGDLKWPVLRKPFRAEQLNAAVHRALGETPAPV